MPKQQIDWKICVGLPTQCYRNLNNGLMSIRQKIGSSWLVVGHTDNLIIQNPIFHVSETSRQRVIRTRKKNVHAWGCGILVGRNLKSLPQLKEISYDPYLLPFFSWRDIDRRIDRADYLIIIDNRAYCPIDLSQSQLTLF
ncbi:hypothetical protein [Chamaesiphon polymorphus]|uniref:Uncharacterized protein n=1 Tax=Chamaesiphon polymorphus CCALA 037 TaxID=2107692 RepID=A0A2T1G2X6_9CYAN|nr:hypothetical protein [Chamaesiphon polymorphus]PSB51581.1 hypothetical protein C7B77_21460 [Chamaesiphon polymorphus CCALA 037]